MPRLLPYEPATENERREMLIVVAARVWRLRRMLRKAESELESLTRMTEANDG
jgi:hypothetical protein